MTPPIVPGPDPPSSTIFQNTRNVTTTDMEEFQNPDNLLKKRFMESLDPDNEIHGYRRRKNGTVQYEVLWEDCDEPLDVDEDEMMSMVKESFYVT